MKYGVFLLCYAHLCINLKAQNLNSANDILYNNRVDLSYSKNFIDSFSFLETIAQHRVIHIGTPLHTNGSAFLLANSMVKYLHENHGFNVIVLEEPMLQVWAMTEFIERNRCNPLSVYGDGNLFICNRENQSRWAYFSDRVKADTIEVYGSDMTYYNDSTNAFIRDRIEKTCNRLSMDINKYQPTLMHFMGFSRVGAYPLREAHSNIAQFIEELKLKSAQASNEDAMLIQTLEGALAFDRWPNRDKLSNKGAYSRYTKIMSYRDSIMASNFFWLMKLVSKESKVIVLTTNYHAIRNVCNDSICLMKKLGSNKFLGDYLHTQYGSDVFSIAIISGDVKLATSSHKKLFKRREIKKQSLEFYLQKKRCRFCFFNLQKISRSDELEFFMKPTFERFYKTFWHRHYDSILFISNSSFITPNCD